MIDEDWPFLHLNLVSPPQPTINSHDGQLQVHADQVGDNRQEISHVGFDPAQLEAWTNVNFNFEEIPQNPSFPQSTFNNSNNNNNNSSTTGLDDPFSFNSASPISPTTNNSSTNPFLNSLENTLIFDNPTSNTTTNLDSFQTVLPVPGAQRTGDEALGEKAYVIKSSEPTKGRVQSTQKYSRNSSNTSGSQKSSTKAQPNEDGPSNKNSDGSPAEDEDEANRVSPEDDKRRRNTLASARFRMKKKMKEQEIERTAKEMKEKVSELEKQIEGLKQENKWLRGLILDQTNLRLKDDDSNVSRLSSLASTTSKINHNVGETDGGIEDLNERSKRGFTESITQSKRKRFNNPDRSINVPSNN